MISGTLAATCDLYRCNELTLPFLPETKDHVTSKCNCVTNMHTGLSDEQRICVSALYDY